ncbi:hypothetical protein ACFFX0_31255 [Citricoccus parietis]|uniref:Uncharacterized protein n=1 Tax=Citricoccus parietis TaxID=592307 RepID=A0ABV5G8X9_9MICC
MLAPGLHGAPRPRQGGVHVVGEAPRRWRVPCERRVVPDLGSDGLRRAEDLAARGHLRATIRPGALCAGELPGPRRQGGALDPDPRPGPVAR